MRILREMKEKGLPLLPHFHFILNFRRNLIRNPHLVREIDQLTGKILHYRPSFLRSGRRKVRAQGRILSKKEKKQLSLEPKFLTPQQLGLGRYLLSFIWILTKIKKNSTTSKATCQQKILIATTCV